MRKLLRLGMLAGLAAGAMYAWRRLQRRDEDFYDVMREHEQAAGRTGQDTAE